MADLRQKLACHRFKRYDHWAIEHKADGSLPLDVKSYDQVFNTNPNSSSPSGSFFVEKSTKATALGFNSVLVP